MIAASRAGVISACQQCRKVGDKVSGFATVPFEGGNHIGHIDRAVIWMPAVKIGDHGDCSITKLCFAGEFRLGHVGHANHIAAPLFIEFAFGHRRKLRTFHREIRAAVVGFDTCSICGSETGRG